MRDRVLNEFRYGVDAETLHDLRLVELDGGERDGQAVGNLLGGAALALSTCPLGAVVSILS